MIDIVPTFFCLIVTILSCWHEIKREAEFQDLKTKMECIIAVTKRDSEELNKFIEKRKREIQIYDEYLYEEIADELAEINR